MIDSKWLYCIIYLFLSGRGWVLIPFPTILIVFTLVYLYGLFISWPYHAAFSVTKCSFPSFGIYIDSCLHIDHIVFGAPDFSWSLMSSSGIWFVLDAHTVLPLFFYPVYFLHHHIQHSTRYDLPVLHTLFGHGVFKNRIMVSDHIPIVYQSDNIFRLQFKQ